MADTSIEILAVLKRYLKLGLRTKNGHRIWKVE